MIYHGDCIDVMATLPAESVDACVTDPPYELTTGKRGGSGAASVNLESPHGRARIGTGNGAGGFMGKAWDATGIAHDPVFWATVLRVLKPGAFLLACGGPRTYHRMAAAVEDAGFEIRDCLAWLFGSGFPKSLNLGEGLGTALKPAHEPIVLARKPFKGTVKGNVEKFGTVALNIDACRVGDAVDTRRAKGSGDGAFPYSDDNWTPHLSVGGQCDAGRWPANVALDELAAMVLDEQSGELASGEAHLLRRGATTGSGIGYGSGSVGHDAPNATYGDSGGASRFYYVAKPSREERDMWVAITFVVKQPRGATSIQQSSRLS